MIKTVTGSGRPLSPTRNTALGKDVKSFPDMELTPFLPRELTEQFLRGGSTKPDARIFRPHPAIFVRRSHDSTRRSALPTCRMRSILDSTFRAGFKITNRRVADAHRYAHTGLCNLFDAGTPATTAEASWDPRAMGRRFTDGILCGMPETTPHSVRDGFLRGRSHKFREVMSRRRRR